MGKRRRIQETIKRIFVTAMALVMVVNIISGFAMDADAAGEAQEDERVADTSTVDSYKDFLNIEESTLKAGRIWTDKSVYAIDGSNGSYSVNIDGTPVTYGVTPKDDFLEVFSALGSSAVVNGEEDAPLDVMFVLDMSGSMGSATDANDYTTTRLAYAVDALNSAFDYVQNQNDYNRVGLYIYSGDGNYGSSFWEREFGQSGTDAGNGRGILGLGRYTADNNEYFSVGGKGRPDAPEVTGSMGRVWMRVNVNENTMIDGINVHDKRAEGTDYRTDYPLKDKIGAAGATNTQTGLYYAMNALATEEKTTVTINGKPVTRLPVVILLTDGVPTISYSGTSWWNPDSDVVKGSGDTPYCYGNYMLAMATASYMKREINLNYYGVSNPAGENSAKVFTFGIDLTDAEEQEIAEAFLNPKEHFDSETNATSKQIKGAWEQYLRGGSVDIPVESPKSNPTAYSDYYTLTHPTGDIKDIDTLVYNDEYRSVSSDNLNTILQQVLNSIHNTVAMPIEGLNDLDEDSVLSYSDPIGEYMQVNDIFQLNLLGKVYNVQPNGNGSYYVAAPGGNRNVEIINTSYGEDSDVTFNLNEINIWVESTITDGLKHDVLRVDIPAAALPIRTATIDYKLTHESGNTKQIIDKYTTNIENEEGEINAAALPLRLFYTVGMQDDYLKTDGSIDLSKISEEYKELHRDPETGRVNFYSNDYSSSSYIYNNGLNLSDRGDAFTTFSAADSNRYYIYQDYLPLYTAKNDPESYVTSPAQCDTDGIYYFDFKYYTADLTEKTEQIEYTGAMFGSGVSGSEYGEFLVWYNLENHEIEENFKEYPGGDGWIVATKIGGIRVGNMDGNSDKVQKGEGNNKTGTSNTYYLPTVRSNNNGVILTNYLGNNGVRSAGDVTMLLTKQVESDKAGYQSEPFSFTVSIPSMANKANVTAIKYKLYSDGDSEYWLRMEDEEETTVEVSEDGFLIETDGTITDIKVTDRKVTVSDDGKKGTVTADNDEVITVYEVSFENGVATYAYHYKINLQPETEAVTFDNEGKANVTLKHGEGLLFDSLEENEEISVIETLTKTQYNAGYRLKEVQGESGELSAEESDGDNDSKLYTVEKALNSVNNEVHWFNKTVTPKLEIAKTQTVDGETDDSLTVEAGDEVTYSLTVTNTGDAPAEGVVVTDVIPEGLTLKEGTISNNGSLQDDGKTILWNIETIDAEGSVTVTFTVTVPNVDKNTTWENIATVSFENNPENPTEPNPSEPESPHKGRIPENSNEVEIWEYVEPHVKVEKTQIKNETTLGAGYDDSTDELLEVNSADKVTYYLKVTSDGTTTAEKVIVTDEIPSGLTLVTGSISHDGKLLADNKTIMWELDDMAPHASITVHFQVTVPKITEAKEWENIATVSNKDPENADADFDENSSTGDPHRGRTRTKDTSDEVKIKGIPVDPNVVIEKEQQVTGKTRTRQNQDVESGDIVTYYLIVTSNGTTTAANVAVTDKIPAGLEFVTGSIKIGDDSCPDSYYSGTTNTITWMIDEMAPQTSKTLSFQVKVPEVNEAMTWTNIGTVTFDDMDDPNEPNKSNEVEITEEVPEPGTPALDIKKAQSVNDGGQTTEKQTVVFGDKVTYYITVESIGDATAESVIVTDEIPDGLELVENSISHGGRLLADGKTILWELDNMEPGDTETVHFQVTVPKVYEVTTWENIGQVSFNDPNDPVTPDPSDPDDPHKGRIPKDSNKVEITEDVKNPNVTIVKEQAVNDGARTEDTQKVNGDDVVTYYLTVTNEGEGTAEDVIVTDEIPDGLVLDENSISDNGELLDDGKTIIWYLDDIGLGESRTVSFTVTVPALNEDKIWTNFARVSSKDPANDDEDTGSEDPHRQRDRNKSNEVEISEIPGIPSVTIAKDQSVNGGTRTTEIQEVKDGDEVTYYLTVKSNGEIIAKDVIVTDEIPGGLTLVTGSISDRGRLLDDKKTIVWNLGNMEPGIDKTVSFRVTVPVVTEDTIWTNFANASNYDPNNPDDESSDPGDPHKGRTDPNKKKSNEVQIEVKIKEDPGIPNVTITKEQSVNGGTRTTELREVKDGDEVTYYLTVKSNGETTAEDVIVTDKVPDGLVLDETSISDNGRLLADGKTIVWNLGDMASGTDKTVSFKVTVPKVTKETTWTNFANASNKDPNKPDDSGSDGSDAGDPHKGRTSTKKESNQVKITETSAEPNKPATPNKPAAPNVTIAKDQSVNGGTRTTEIQEVKDGDRVTYYLTVKSNGEITAKDVIVTDEIPSGLTLVTGSISNGGTLLADGKTIVWNLGNMGPNDSITVSFTVTVPIVSMTTYWENIGKVSYDDPSNPPPQNPDPNDPHGGRTTDESNKVEIVERGKLLKTGDDWNGILWIALFAASGIAFAAMSFTTIISEKVRRKDK